MKVWLGGLCLLIVVLVVLGLLTLPRGLAAARFSTGPRDEAGHRRLSPHPQDR